MASSPASPPPPPVVPSCPAELLARVPAHCVHLQEDVHERVDVVAPHMGRRRVTLVRRVPAQLPVAARAPREALRHEAPAVLHPAHRLGGQLVRRDGRGHATLRAIRGPRRAEPPRGRTGGVAVAPIPGFLLPPVPLLLAAALLLLLHAVRVEEVQVLRSHPLQQHAAEVILPSLQRKVDVDVAGDGRLGSELRPLVDLEGLDPLARIHVEVPRLHLLAVLADDARHLFRDLGGDDGDRAHVVELGDRVHLLRLGVHGASRQGHGRLGSGSGSGPLRCLWGASLNLYGLGVRGERGQQPGPRDVGGGPLAPEEAAGEPEHSHGYGRHSHEDPGQDLGWNPAPPTPIRGLGENRAADSRAAFGS